MGNVYASNERTAGLTDIFNEVEEDLRREQYLKIWQKYGRVGLGIFIGAILVVSGYVIWQNYQEGRHRAQSAVFHEFLSAEPAPEGVAREAALVELIDELDGGYNALARLELASTFVASEKYPEAISLYEDIAEDGGVERSLRDIAALKGALLQAEVLSLADMRQKVERLAAPGHPLRFSAGELLGYVAYRTGDLTAAEAYLSAVRDDVEVPSNTGLRVADLLAFMAGKGEVASNKPTEPQPEQPATEVTSDK